MRHSPTTRQPPSRADLELERERIRKENQRKKDEREDQLNKANQKIAELNARFADWYYIISEDEYKRVHLNRNDSDPGIGRRAANKGLASIVPPTATRRTGGTTRKSPPAVPPTLPHCLRDWDAKAQSEVRWRMSRMANDQ